MLRNQKKKISSKKIKNFGYSFSIIFFFLSIYLYFIPYEYFYIFLVISILFSIVSKFFYPIFKYPCILWEIFGIYIGIIISPIVLALIYLITVFPVNIILRIIKISQKIGVREISDTYWVEIKEKKINFKVQF